MTSIIVRFSFEGFHSWPAAAKLSTEAYLANTHRHLFFVEAKRLVSHDDRDIEFLSFSRKMREYCETHLRDPHTLSCEHMAARLLTAFHLSSCKVFEDNECGAEVTVEAQQ